MSSQKLERYSNNIKKDLLNKNIEKYGYPFVGEIWQPHISIASFNVQDFEKFYDSLNLSFPRGRYLLDSFVVYQLDEKSEKITEIFRKKLPLKS